MKRHLLPPLFALELIRPRLHVFRKRRIRERFRDRLRLLRGAEESFLKVRREFWSREVDELLQRRRKRGNKVSGAPLPPVETQKTHLEALCIPPLDLFDTRHLVESMRQLVELLDPMCEANGKFRRKELGSAKESSLQTSARSASCHGGSGEQGRT